MKKKTNIPVIDATVRSRAIEARSPALTESVSTDVPRNSLASIAVGEAVSLDHSLELADAYRLEANERWAAINSGRNKLQPHNGMRYQLGRLVGKSVTENELVALQGINRAPDLLIAAADREEDRAAKHEEAVSLEVKTIREELAGLDPNNTAVIDRYFSTAPTYVRQWKSEAYADKTWADWLSNAASEQELIEIMRWHETVLDEQVKDPEIQQQVTSQRHAFREATHAMFMQGFLSRESRDVMSLRVVIGDVFDTLARARQGYYILGANEIVVKQGMGSDEETRRKSTIDALARTLPHEFSHYAVDRWIGKGTALSDRWIDEALTEQMTRAVRWYATRSLEDDSVYRRETELLNVLTREDVRVERLALRAYSGGVNELGEFSRRLDVLWGIDDVLLKVNRTVKTAEAERAHAGVKEGAMQNAALEYAVEILEKYPNYLNQFGVGAEKSQKEKMTTDD